MDTQTHVTSPPASEPHLPTFQEWWGHLQRSGLLAAAQARLSPEQLAEMATQTYQLTLRQIEEQAALARLVDAVSHPYGDA